MRKTVTALTVSLTLLSAVSVHAVPNTAALDKATQAFQLLQDFKDDKLERTGGEAADQIRTLLQEVTGIKGLTERQQMRCMFAEEHMRYLAGSQLDLAGARLGLRILNTGDTVIAACMQALSK